MSTTARPHHHPLIRRWNATDREFAADAVLPDLLDAAAAAHPDAPAVRTTAGVALTHRRLAEASRRMALALAGAGVRPRTPVALLADHVPEAVVAMHATVRAGAFYVPLDPRWPVRRTADVIESIGARHLVATAGHLADAERLRRAVGRDLTITVTQEEPGPVPTDRPAPAAPAGAEPADLAYTIFTSGSTGLPKAVAVRHSSVVNLIEWFNRRNGVGPDDILLQVASFGFDLSVYDVFGAPAAGASILLLTAEELADPERIAAALVAHGVTLWNSAPALFTTVSYFLDESSYGRRRALRRVFLSGDWIPLTTPAVVRAEFPGATLVALGGATEACVWSNDFVVHEVDQGWDSIPYGRPMQNSRYYVLREDLSPCDIGEPGELFISGACVAQGYINDPELSARRFLPDPWDEDDRGWRMYRTGDRARWTSQGWIEFLGRLDSQVKVRGYRIELGEVEQAARHVPGVEEALAVAAGDPRDPFIALALRSAETLDAATVRAHLAQRLPPYMCPARVLVTGSLPLGSTGKVDRAALRQAFTDGAGAAFEG
ncbi:amino acid adenylation domain-containing protein [Kitasatospora sp. NPDC059747]|uniref:amino acid adenylation domain-containing protein n=1 Tax=Kitasatospora sp. NPDC059747 TaxID=3346930 RepID=UPI003669AABA